MLSIYNIENWGQNKNYNIYDIYRYNNLYYYAISRHSSGITFNNDFSDGIIEYNGQLKPFFFFKPSYNSNIDITPTVKRAQFGDGYSQRIPENLNAILLPFNLTFDKRTDAETRAILHFITQRQGSTSFVMIPPFPFNIPKLFVAEKFSHTQIFANNHTIQIFMQEVPI